MSRYIVKFSLLKKHLENPEMGISKTVNFIGEQEKNNYNEIYFVRAENAQLRIELDLMRSMFIKLDRKWKLCNRR